MDDALGLPILSSKSCDDTPMNVAQWSNHTLPTGKKVRVRGREGREFLVSNQFVRAFLPDVSTRTAVLMSAAVPLHKGKTARAVLAAPQGLGLCARFGAQRPLAGPFRLGQG